MKCLTNSIVRTNCILICPALGIEVKGRNTVYFSNYKAMGYSLVRKIVFAGTVIKLEDHEMGRPDGTAKKKKKCWLSSAHSSGARRFPSPD